MEFTKKVCLLLFLAAIFSGRTNELGVLVGSVTGTILLWPIYRKYAPAPLKKRRVVIEETQDEEPVAAPER
ncbi:MAG: hypothetical protein K2X35_10165 [Bryobacteraceae bacterium]|nr:hypothetical protein [Bryobacteraceae bacterium]